MLNESMTHQVVSLSIPDDINPENPCPDLRRLLSELAEKLDPLQDTSIDQGDWSEPVPDRWEDDSYCYYEVKVPEWAASEVDLTVANGRAFIRVAR